MEEILFQYTPNGLPLWIRVLILPIKNDFHILRKISLRTKYRQPRSQGFLPFLYREGGPPDVNVRRPANEIEKSYLF